jgi:WD40 repeat protein/tRNA A-37 threonylcarbamoyl transferase component Bud32
MSGKDSKLLSSPLFCDRCGAANRDQARFCRVCGEALLLAGDASFSTNGTAGNSTLSISTTLTGLLTMQHTLKQRYMILSPIGRGGFGAVYKASDTLFGNRLVAVKEMSQNSLSAQELLEANEAFRREAMMLASLTHPNLPRIFEQFTDTGRSYLVMDYIEGETLEEHLNKSGSRNMPVEQVLNIAFQLCSVLDYLHTRQPPIIFRDLKPANVMLTATNHIYLIDFGIARHFKPGQTKDTSALGSSGYAAPEQYGRSQTTVRADLYSLGATLHQLLTGNDPTENPFQFAPLKLPHPALAGLDTLIMSMVSVDIDKRPVSAASVRQELERIANQYALVQRQPLPASSAAYTYQPPSPVLLPKPKRARTTSQPPQGQSNTLYVCTGHTSRVTAVAWSPDGTLFASASYDRTVRVWSAPTGQLLQTYKRHRGRVHALAWSPDSQRIASASSDHTVQVWEARTGTHLGDYLGHSGNVYAVTWSPDGLLLASAGEDKVVHVWMERSRTVFFLHKDHTGEVLTLAWSPDRKRIVSAGKDRKIHIWDPFKDQQKRPRGFFEKLSSFLAPYEWQKTLTDVQRQVNAVAWSPDSRYLAVVSNDRSVRVWEQDTLNRPVFRSNSVGSSIRNSVSWSPDGRYLAAGSHDKTVQIWNFANRVVTPIYTYNGHTGYVMTAAWSPDGSRIASSGVDRSIQVWQVTR